jgi:large subunit ribosomal protein L24
MGNKLKKSIYPVKLKIRKGDEVMVISGKDGPKPGGIKGKIGRVIQAFPKTNKLIVEGANIMIKHQKPRQRGKAGATGVQQIQEGGRMELAAPMNVSKVMLICPQCHRPTRIGYAYREGNEKLSHRKYRVCKHPDCGKSID